MKKGIHLHERMVFELPVETVLGAKDSLLSDPDSETLIKTFEQIKEEGDAFIATVATGMDNQIYCGVFPVKLETSDNPSFYVNLQSEPVFFSFERDGKSFYELLHHAEREEKPIAGIFSFHYNTFSDHAPVWTNILKNAPQRVGIEVIQTNLLKDTHSGASLSNFVMQNGIISNYDNIHKEDGVENVLTRILEMSLMSKETLNNALKHALSPVRFSMALDFGSTPNAEGLNEINKNLTNITRFTKMKNMGWKHYVDTPYFKINKHINDLKKAMEVSRMRVDDRMHTGNLAIQLDITKNLIENVRTVPGIQMPKDLDISKMQNLFQGAAQTSITQDGKLNIELGSNLKEIVETLEKVKNRFDFLNNIKVSYPINESDFEKLESPDEILSRFVSTIKRGAELGQDEVFSFNAGF